MKKVKLAIFTAGRSDFGIMQNLLKKIEKSKKIDQTIIVGPAHQLQIFGNTKKEILNNNFKKIFFLKNNFLKKKNVNTSILISKIINNTSELLEKNQFNAAIILGDRYEMFSFSIACMNFNLPIIHLGGGSVTLGSHDDIYRNAISLMSKMHLVETKKHKENLINNGIRKNIYVIGAPALENLGVLKKDKKIDIFKNLDKNKNLIVSCFHPETNKSYAYNRKNLKILINFLNYTKQNIIFTYPNADEGYLKYIKEIHKKLNKKNTKIIKSLGILKYHKLLSQSSLLIGNSSSGIIESCSFKIPFINLGNRQKGRYAPKNVVNCNFRYNEIIKKYKKVNSQNFKRKLLKLNNPYHVINSSEKAYKYIYNFIRNIK